MRRLSWLLLVLVGCAPDRDPVKTAELFHARLLAGDDGGAHALLTEADRSAVPLESFPDALPRGRALAVLKLGVTELDSAALLREERDTAVVALHLAGGAADTLRLVALHVPRKLWRFELDRVRWRVAMGIAERLLLDSLAAAMRRSAAESDISGAEQAKAYLVAAERHPEFAYAAEVNAARSTVRLAALADSLSIALRVAETYGGATVIDGRIENPTGTRIRSMQLVVQGAGGAEERVDLRGLAPGSTTPVRQPSMLRTGPVTYRLTRIQP